MTRGRRAAERGDRDSDLRRGVLDPAQEERFRAANLHATRRDVLAVSLLAALWHTVLVVRTLLRDGPPALLDPRVGFDDVFILAGALALALVVHRVGDRRTVVVATCLGVLAYTTAVALTLAFSPGFAVRGAVLLALTASGLYLVTGLPLRLTALLGSGPSLVVTLAWLSRRDVGTSSDGAYVAGVVVLINVLCFLSASRSQAVQRRLFAAGERMEELASRDALTGIANRRAADEHLALEWARCSREHEPLAVLVIDVDRFKELNDRDGHARGDEVLQRLAEVLEGCVERPGDLVARWGGEEFVLVLPGTDGAGAEQVAERVIDAVRRAGDVTVSVGFAASDSPPSGHRDVLVRSADAALYRAKEGGRDRWHAHRPAAEERPVLD